VDWKFKEMVVFLHRIITGDETWGRRVNGRAWNGNIHNRPKKKKFKSQPSAGNLLLTVFWDSTKPNTGTL
jgi:hypothetical protein